MYLAMMAARKLSVEQVIHHYYNMEVKLNQPLSCLFGEILITNVRNTAKKAAQKVSKNYKAFSELFVKCGICR